MADTAISVTY